VSWLLVALIPGLLMLATFGLERLESGLHNDTVSATDVVKFLEQAEPDDVNTLARDGMSRALHSLQQRLDEREWPLDAPTNSRDLASLPRRVYVHHGSNPEFRPTRHANRV
jgi:acetyl esterase/lipase